MILIGDDDRDVRRAASLLFEEQGLTVGHADSPQRVRELAEQADCVLLDLNYRRDTTSGVEGLTLLRALQEQHPDLPIVVMTAWGTVDIAVEALKAGAADFVEKPWENERLLSIVRAQLALRASRAEQERLAAENALLKGADDELIAASPAMREVVTMLKRVAPTDANILLRGDNGTGKTFLARLAHRWSQRATQPFISVNMGAIPEHLFESEMFGHRKGAFTDARENRIGRFELAASGTLFLDEIANIPASQQPKLLRVLESHEFERVGESRSRTSAARVISATNGDIEQLITDGQFRQDLLYRLNTVEIRIPALNERRDDILPLASQTLQRLAIRYQRSPTLTEDAKARLTSYAWPGNVRELQHVVERAVILSAGDRITPRELNLADPLAASAQPLRGTLDDIERRALQQALDRHHGSVDRAAEELGISRSACYRRLEKHDLKPSSD